MHVWQMEVARLPDYLSLPFQNNQRLGNKLNAITGFPAIEDNRTSTVGI
jgi:hypothetical protein